MSCPVRRPATANRRANATIGVLVPLTEDCHSTAGLGLPYQQLACAALVAVAHFNAGSTIVVPTMSGLTAQSTSRTGAILLDTLYTSRGALLAANNVLQEGVDSVLGTARSTSTASSAQLSYLFDAPQLSYWASSPALSDPVAYPMFSRTYASDVVVTQALCKMISSFDWAAIGVVTDRYDLYASAYADQIREHAPTYGVAVIASPTFIEQNEESQQEAVRTLATSRVNVFVAVVVDRDAPTLFAAADAQGLLSAGYVWIVGDALTSSAAQGATMSHLSGLLQFYSSASASGEGFLRFKDAWGQLSTARGDCNNSIFDAVESPRIFTEAPFDVAAFVYDGAVALAAAMASAGPGASGGEIHAALLNLSFDGASGHVAFDPQTGDRALDTLNFAFDNWVARNGTLTVAPAGTFSLSAGRAHSSWVIEWPGGVTTQPSDAYEPPTPSLLENLGATFTSWRIVAPAVSLGLTLPVSLAARQKLRGSVSTVSYVGIVLSSIAFCTDLLFVAQVSHVPTASAPQLTGTSDEQ